MNINKLYVETKTNQTDMIYSLDMMNKTKTNHSQTLSLPIFGAINLEHV